MQKGAAYKLYREDHMAECDELTCREKVFNLDSYKEFKERIKALPPKERKKLASTMKACKNLDLFCPEKKGDEMKKNYTKSCQELMCNKQIHNLKEFEILNLGQRQ